MKKLIFITLMAFLLIPALVFSEEQATATDTSMDMSKGMEMGQGMKMCKSMGKEMGGDCGKMCMMMQKQMVATSDGGVIVLSGNKLYKYDKDLNPVKEVEIKMDVEGMMKMMEQCSMKMKMMPEEKSAPVTEEKKE